MPTAVLTTTRQNFWTTMYRNENKLRLKWFRKNAQTISDAVGRKPKQKVTDDVKKKFVENRLVTYKEMRKTEDNMDDKVENEYECLDIMKPIDPDVKKILYSSIPEARDKYLHERYKIRPEDRFYYPETSNVIYGWDMWESPRQYRGFGRQPIIKNSFYRRNGVERDPDWYKEPNKLSPTVCGSI